MPVVLRIAAGDAGVTENSAKADRQKGALTRHGFWHRYRRVRPDFRPVILQAVLLRLLTGTTDRLCRRQTYERQLSAPTFGPGERRPLVEERTCAYTHVRMQF